MPRRGPECSRCAGPARPDNSLLTESTRPYHLPPFGQIKDAHFAPAFEQGMTEELKEVEAISHTFAGGYSAGYYSYLWSEVLDADSVEWLKAHGGLTRANGDHFRATLQSRGGSEDAMVLFRNFTGGKPYLEPLLKRRGLDQAAP